MHHRIISRVKYFTTAKTSTGQIIYSGKIGAYLKSMETILTQTVSPQPQSFLRAFDPARDLDAVADLVELCFSSTLDADGHRYLRQMRSAARNPSFLRIAGNLGDALSFPMSGFVWVDNSKLVGNLSLIPFPARKKRTYLIANVAVHPDFRRQGIARALTDAALRHLHSIGADFPWLQVRDDNPPAIQLYESLGFQEQFRRTTWHLKPKSTPQLAPPTAIKIVPLQHKHTKKQQQWLHEAYPTAFEWHMPFKISDLRPGILGFFARMFNGVFVRQWAATLQNELVGTAAWQSTAGYYNYIWLGLAPESEEPAAHALLCYFAKVYGQRHTLSVDFPTGKVENALSTCGFNIHQTLIWKRATNWI